jgi:integrase
MEYLEAQDLKKLFRTIHKSGNKMHLLAALCAFWTGARVSQVLALEGQDIFEADGKFVIKIHALKGGKSRLHPLHIDTDPAFDLSPLIELAKTRPTSRLFGGLSRSYLNLCLKKYCAKAGIHTDAAHMHIFRHSIAMQIWSATHSLGAITEFLQHKSPQSALQYLSEHNGQVAQGAVDAIQFSEV